MREGGEARISVKNTHESEGRSEKGTDKIQCVCVCVQVRVKINVLVYIRVNMRVRG